MEMTLVKSSQIEAVGFEAPDGGEVGLLRVRFTGGAVYEYERVSAPFYTRLLVAESVGRCFQEVKARPDLYPCRKVAPARAKGPEGSR